MREEIGQRSGGKSQKGSLYQEVTDKILRELEAGRVPWVQPWGETETPLGMPSNAATARRYTGVNVLILWSAAVEKGFASHRWLTFRQALSLGGNVRKGERGTAVCYADRYIPKGEAERAAKEGNEPEAVPFLKRFTVFNASQCEGLPEHVTPAPLPVPEGQAIPHAEALIAATGADFRIGGNEACYVPAADYIQVPTQAAFFEPVNYYRTCFHELGHWTGHASRLVRDLSAGFGSSGYAREELVAEIASAFLCASLGIVPTVRHADYLASWLEVLREDNRAIFRAASQASKAADYLLAYAAQPVADAGAAA